MTEAEKKAYCKMMKNLPKIQVPVNLLMAVWSHMLALDKSVGAAIPYVAYALELRRDEYPEANEECENLIRGRPMELQITLALAENLRQLLNDEMSEWSECQPGGRLYGQLMRVRRAAKTGKTENDKDGD